MPEITFCRPIKTLPVSLTGQNCALNCPWCGGYYLRGMKSPDDLKSSDLSAYRSFLISGGYDANGKLPIKENFLVLKQLKEQGFRLNIHYGICDREELELIKPLNPAISFDLNLDEDLLAKAGFKIGRKTVQKSYELLFGAGFAPVPHLLLGRNRGRILPESEYFSLDFLTDFTPKSLVFLVFVPAGGSVFADFSSPEIKEIEKMFGYARRKLPDSEFYLGCMSPRGILRDEIDLLALKYDFKKIVMPGKAVKKYAGESGFIIKNEEECCGFAGVSRDCQCPGA